MRKDCLVVNIVPFLTFRQIFWSFRITDMNKTPLSFQEILIWELFTKSLFLKLLIKPYFSIFFSSMIYYSKEILKSYLCSRGDVCQEYQKRLHEQYYVNNIFQNNKIPLKRWMQGLLVNIFFFIQIIQLFSLKCLSPACMVKRSDASRWMFGKLLAKLVNKIIYYHHWLTKQIQIFPTFCGPS